MLVFFSYSHKDDRYRQELQVHLTALQRQMRGDKLLWDDRKILPGRNWQEEIEDKLDSADIVILLVSPHFIASDYCYTLEMERALERHTSGMVHVVPVIVRPCDWKHTPLGALQALPEDGHPITTARNRDSAWNEVVEGIRRLIESQRLPSASSDVRRPKKPGTDTPQRLVRHGKPTNTKRQITANARIEPIRVLQTQSFLSVFSSASTGTLTVRIVPSLADALVRSSVPTSVSPIYPMAGASTKVPLSYAFSGRSNLLFLGPSPVNAVVDQCDPSCLIWLTVGSLNIVVATKDVNSAIRLKDWAQRRHLRWQNWHLDMGRVIEVEESRMPKNVSPFVKSVMDIRKCSVSLHIQGYVEDYCGLMAAAVARAATFAPPLAEDLLKVNSAIEDLLSSGQVNRWGDPWTADMLYTVNHALSELNCQALSCLFPATANAPALGMHSLLGTGIATLALHNIYWFAADVLAGGRIPERLATLLDAASGTPQELLSLRDDDDFWYRDNLAPVTISCQNSSTPIIPLLPYLNDRDGFHATDLTLSVPWQILRACNTIQCNAVAITHELTHCIVRAALTQLLPCTEDSWQPDRLIELLSKSTPRKCLRDEVYRALFVCLVSMDQAPHDWNGLIDVAVLRGIVRRQFLTLSETMTDVLEYLYFYGCDPELFLKTRWLAWTSAGKASNHAPEFLVRSICSLLVTHLRRGSRGIEIAISQATQILKDIQTSRDSSPFVESALGYLEAHSESVTYQVRVRKDLVKLTRAFLYSASIAAPLQSGDSDMHLENRSYIEPMTFRRGNSGNPFRFLWTFGQDAESSPSKSAWMLNTLAFIQRVETQPTCRENMPEFEKRQKTLDI